MSLKKKVELLCPAGDFPSLRAAIKKGADAVYFGLKKLNMRANAKNFSISELDKVVKLCHSSNVKAYLTINTIVYEKEMPLLKKIILASKKANVDAIIAWDFSVINEAIKKGINVHLSTQSSVSNSSAIELYYKKFGIKRFNLARECSLEDIRKIVKNVKKKKLPIQIEVFCHGAMCVAYSGRCFTSQFLYGKSANRGECIQPCRRQYIVKDIETDKELEIVNYYIMSPKDLCTIEILDKLIESGISSLKIEGRARSPEYVMEVVSCYRQAIDDYYSGKLTNQKKKELIERLKRVYNRGFSTGFYLGLPNNSDWCGVYGSVATTKKVYVGRVTNYYSKISVAKIKCETRGISLNQTMMIQGPTTGVIEQKICSIEENKNPIISAKKGSEVAVKVNDVCRRNDKVFLILEAKEVID